MIREASGTTEPRDATVRHVVSEAGAVLLLREAKKKTPSPALCASHTSATSPQRAEVWLVGHLGKMIEAPKPTPLPHTWGRGRQSECRPVKPCLRPSADLPACGRPQSRLGGWQDRRRPTLGSVFEPGEGHCSTLPVCSGVSPSPAATRRPLPQVWGRGGVAGLSLNSWKRTNKHFSPWGRGR